MRLHCAGLIVSVVNPAQVRALVRGLGMLSKTDLMDALLLAQYARLAQPRQWRPTMPQLQEFSAMLMRLDCLEVDLRLEQNRREQAAVRGSSDCVLFSVDACIDFLRVQCKAMPKTIDSTSPPTNRWVRALCDCARFPPSARRQRSAWPPS